MVNLSQLRTESEFILPAIFTQIYLSKNHGKSNDLVNEIAKKETESLHKNGPENGSRSQLYERGRLRRKKVQTLNSQKIIY